MTRYVYSGLSDSSNPEQVGNTYNNLSIYIVNAALTAPVLRLLAQRWYLLPMCHECKQLAIMYNGARCLQYNP